MPKYMNNKYLMNLQIFAEGEDESGTGDDSGDGDDQDDDQEDDSDEGGEDEPKFTQADLDKAVARTIAKERAKAERAKKREAQKQKNSGSPDGGDKEDDPRLKEAEARAIKAETRAACFEAGVDKDAIDDVTALAHSYMEMDEDLDLEDAIEKVVKKYPHFKKRTDDLNEDGEETRGRAWGERQRGRGAKYSGVEAAFLKKNPGLKID